MKVTNPADLKHFTIGVDRMVETQKLMAPLPSAMRIEWAVDAMEHTPFTMEELRAFLAIAVERLAFPDEIR